MTFKTQTALSNDHVSETTTHRTDEFTIVRKIAKLIQENRQLPTWEGGNSVGWRNTRSKHWNAQAEQICQEHGITSQTFCKLTRLASEYLEATE